MELKNLPAPAQVSDPTLRGLYASDAHAPVRRDERQILKVRIPVRLHLRLHAMRITQGDTVSATVEAALEQYFARMAAERGAGMLQAEGGQALAL